MTKTFYQNFSQERSLCVKLLVNLSQLELLRLGSILNNVANFVLNFKNLLKRHYKCLNLIHELLRSLYLYQC